MTIAIRKIALAFVFSFSSYVALNAQPTVQSSINNNNILIGQQIQLKVVADLPHQDYFVKWIDIPSTVPHFDLVEASKIDSVFSKQKLSKLSQTFTFTSFDSGRWTLPAFSMYFNPSSGGEAYNLLTDTFSINVSYQRDSTTVLRDIKDISEVAPNSSLQFWLGLLAALFLVALVLWLIYYMFKKNRKKQIAPATITAYQSALAELNKLKQLSLSDAVAVKIFHTKLKEILKTYLSSLQHAHTYNNTTSEILILLQQQGITKDSMTQMAQALRCSDAARFAKYLPSQQESELSWLTIKQAIDFIEQHQNRNTENGA